MKDPSSIPIHFVLLTKLFPTLALSLVRFFSKFEMSWFWFDLIYFEQKESGYKLRYSPSTRTIERIILVTLLQEHIDRFPRDIQSIPTQCNTQETVTMTGYGPMSNVSILNLGHPKKAISLDEELLSEMLGGYLIHSQFLVLLISLRTSRILLFSENGY